MIEGHLRVLQLKVVGDIERLASHRIQSILLSVEDLGLELVERRVQELREDGRFGLIGWSIVGFLLYLEGFIVVASGLDDFVESWRDFSSKSCKKFSVGSLRHILSFDDCEQISKSEEDNADVLVMLRQQEPLLKRFSDGGLQVPRKVQVLELLLLDY